MYQRIAQLRMHGILRQDSACRGQPAQLLVESIPNIYQEAL